MDTRIQQIFGDRVVHSGWYRYHCNIKNGRRWSTARAFLDPAKRRSNLTVLTGAHATEILFDGKRVSGVAFRRNGQDMRVTAEREVVLCGGAVNSPQLLMLSGIGPADSLRGHGIAVRSDLVGVGRNLQDHLDLSICHASREPVTVFRLLPGLCKAVIASFCAPRNGYRYGASSSRFLAISRSQRSPFSSNLSLS